MHRIKWLKVEWNQRYDTVIDAIINDNYNNEKQYGFKAHKRREKFLNATYIFKKEIEEIVENPFTNESIVYQKTIYEQTTFTLEDNELGIEIHNPTRHTQQLLNSFAAMSKFNITIKQIDLNLLECIILLRTKMDKVIVSEIECNNIEIEEHTTIKLIAKNKVADTLEDLEKFLDSKKFTIEKIKCTFTMNTISSNFELTKSGILKTNQSNLEVLLPIMKSVIQSQN